MPVIKGNAHFFFRKVWCINIRCCFIMQQDTAPRASDLQTQSDQTSPCRALGMDSTGVSVLH